MDTNIDLTYASSFISSLSLGVAIIIAIIASVLVLRAARKMGGGLFGTVLNLIGIGMLFVTLGTIAMTLVPWFSQEILSLVHTVFFSLGYICMVLGANKLLRGIMN